MVSMLVRDSQALSSALTLLRTLQPQAFGSLHHVETLDLASKYNYYVDTELKYQSNDVQKALDIVKLLYLKTHGLKTHCTIIVE